MTSIENSFAPDEKNPVVEFDPLSVNFAADPYPVYAALRARPDLHYHEPYDIWLVPRYRDVDRILRSAHMVRTLDDLSPDEVERRRRADNWHDMPHHQRFVQFSLLDSDGPLHQRLRGLVAGAFTPRAIAHLEASTAIFVRKLLDSVADREIDFVEDLAGQVPGRVIGALFGVPAEDSARLRRWSEDIVQFFDLDRSDERKRLAESTTERFYRYVLEIADARRASPREDLMTRLTALWDGGDLDEDEFVSTCMLIVMAGHGSTVDVLSSGMHALLRFPDQLDRLRRDPSRLPTAVQEMFRYESPLPFFHRYCTEPFEIAGRTFLPGTRFGLLYGSANRDPDVFERPDTFDVGRRPNPHKAFGGGAHFCLGIHLARLTMTVFFRELLERFARIDLLDAEPRYKTGLSVRGPRALQVRCTPA